jgi:hypothetical protein
MADADRPRSLLVRYAFGALVLAWCVWLSGLAYGHSIPSRFVGPADDVHDSLTRAGYVAERLLLFDCVAVALGGVASALCCLAFGTVSLSARGVVVCIPCVLSACLHGLVLSGHFVVAG